MASNFISEFLGREIFVNSFVYIDGWTFGHIGFDRTVTVKGDICEFVYHQFAFAHGKPKEEVTNGI